MFLPLIKADCTGLTHSLITELSLVAKSLPIILYWHPIRLMGRNSETDLALATFGIKAMNEELQPFGKN